MTNEQLQQIAEWAGFWWDDKFFGWISPDHDFHYKLPDFLHSLDDCFKWIVPKLTTRWEIGTLPEWSGSKYYCWLAIEGEISPAQGLADTLSEAFCNAVLKYISEVKK